MSEERYYRERDVLPVNCKIQPMTAAEILAGMWVPVAERLPEELKKVLIYSSAFLGCAVDEIEDGTFMCVGVTHWMPLPQPPKEADHG